ncbi:hypothetical protein JOC36_000952 [Weissella uvarum]|uniref:thioredoxin family protein n=1 Tax=Weissella uvarum TaxID=1479233 RepID=UPI001960FA05|nr:thioredoxin family protein [Weissella uvarum]MBM7617395.1 hypothetical protein [Weissella uvarum]MCM0595721.1 thioredoxin family protein [Weissella uvarum]
MAKRSVNNKKSIVAGLGEMSIKEWSVLGVIVLILVLFGIGKYNGYVRSNRIVSKDTVQKAIKEDKTVVFYRDDCSRCRKLLPELLVRNTFKKDVLLVNMNGKHNRPFKAQYKLKQVPTLINKTGTYSGLTNSEYFDAIKAIQKDDGGVRYSNSPDPTVQ